MEILDKKSNRMSRANAGVFECNEFPDLQRILDFLSLRNLLSNELFFTFLFVDNFYFFYLFIAWSKSSIKSFTSSIPTDILKRHSFIPLANLSSKGTSACVWNIG